MTTSEGTSPGVSLRPATPDDMRRIWEWRNEEATRAASFNTEPIPFDVHERWFAARVHGSATRFLIVGDLSGREVGFVRLDLDERTAEMSLALESSARGRGLGRAVIRAAAAGMIAEGVDRVTALVKTSNPASLAAFRNAGFVVDAEVRRGGADAWALQYAPDRPGKVVTPRVVFRVDGGDRIGIGHVQRCLSLAAAVKERGGDAAFVVNADEAVINRVSSAGWHALPADGESWSRADADELVSEARRRRASIVVVDSDLDPPSYISRLREAGLFVCVVEDNGCDEVMANVLLNGDAHAVSQRYRSITGDTSFLLGPMYAPIGVDFRRAPAAAKIPVHSVLLTLGGSDPYQQLPTLLDEASRLPADLHWHVVVGPFTGQASAIARAVELLAGRVTVHHAPTGMRAIIEACDLAVSAAGQTLYELAALGRPTVAMAISGNQEPQLAAFVGTGAVISAGRAGQPGIARHAMELARDLTNDKSRLSAMVRAGRAFIDGRGAERAVDALFALSSAVSAR